MDRMRSVEIQARSREDAIRLALEQLGVKEDDVIVETLAEIEDDFYGEGEVLVRVALKEGVSSPQPERRPRGGARGGQRGGGPRGRQRGGARGGARGGHQRPAPRPVVQPHPPQAIPDETLQEYEQLAKDVVKDLLDHMGVQADIVAVDNPSIMPLSPDDPPTVFVDINGSDLGMIIGRRGDNLSQLQYLVNLLVNRKLDDWVRVIVDVEGYRIRREESLIGLAERVARQVSRNKRPISLEPMPPNERRIVHLTLQNQPSVTTESSGEGAMRRVTIYPQQS